MCSENLLQLFAFILSLRACAQRHLNESFLMLFHVWLYTGPLSEHVYILIRKLFFLRRCIMNENTISGQVLRSILATTTAPSLVQQCHFLEQLLGTNCTDMILSDPKSVPSNHAICDQLINLDIVRSKQIASEHASLRYFSSVCQSVSWISIWDAALEHGSKGFVIPKHCYMPFPNLYSVTADPLSNLVGCTCCIARNVIYSYRTLLHFSRYLC